MKRSNASPFLRIERESLSRWRSNEATQRSHHSIATLSSLSLSLLFHKKFSKFSKFSKWKCCFLFLIFDGSLMALCPLKVL